MPIRERTLCEDMEFARRWQRQKGLGLRGGGVLVGARATLYEALAWEGALAPSCAHFRALAWSFASSAASDDLWLARRVCLASLGGAGYLSFENKF